MATMNDRLHAGSKGNDLEDLHVSLPLVIHSASLSSCIDFASELDKR